MEWGFLTAISTRELSRKRRSAGSASPKTSRRPPFSWRHLKRLGSRARRSTFRVACAEARFMPKLLEFSKVALAENFPNRRDASRENLSLRPGIRYAGPGLIVH